MLRELGKFEAAAASVERALQLAPDNAEAHNNLGHVLQELGRWGAAKRALTRAIGLAPDDAKAHVNLANVSLLSGDWQSGWAEYAWRWKSGISGSVWRDYPQPLWQGERLAGETVYVWAEQGIGDQSFMAASSRRCRPAAPRCCSNVRRG